MLALSGLVFWLVAARLYNADSVGLAAAAIASLTLLGVIANLGLGIGLIRFLPMAGPGDAQTHLINWCLSLTGFMSLVAAAIFLAGLPMWSTALMPLREQPAVLLAFVVFVVFWALHGLQGLIFIAFQRTEFILGKNLLHSLIRVGLVAALVVTFPDLGILYAWAAATIVVVIVVAISFVPRVYPLYRPYFSVLRPPPLSFLRFSLSNGLSTVIQILPATLLPILVVNLLGTWDNVYFYVVWSFGLLLITPSMAFSQSLFAEGSHDERGLARAVRRIALPLFAITGIAALVILAAGDKILLIYGRDYSENGAPLLRLMAIASIPAMISNVYLAVLRVRRETIRILVAVGLLSTSTLISAYVLLQHWGITGAGASWLIGQTAVASVALIHWLTVNTKSRRSVLRSN